MKKSMALMLCLLLAAGMLPLGATAGDVPLPDSLFGTALMDAQQRIYSMAVVNGTAFIRTDQAFFSWQEGKQQAEKLADAAPATNAPAEDRAAADILLNYKGRLLGLHSGRGTLYYLSFAGGEAIYEQALQLDWSPYLQGDEPNLYYATPDWAVIMGNRLFCRFGDVEGGKDLYGFDLGTGQATAYETGKLHKLLPYQGNQLLALQFDSSRTDPNTGQFLPNQVHVFDPSTDTSQPLPLSLPPLKEGAWPLSQNLYWDDAAQQLYVLNDGRLLRLQQKGDPILCARLPVGDLWGGNLKTPALIPWRDDLLLIATQNDVFVRSTDESKLPPIVTLTGSQTMHDTDALSRTMQRLGDVEYQAPQYLSGEDIATRFLVGDMKLDLLVLDIGDSDLQRLAAKGYLMDLSGQPELAAMAEDTLPALHKLMYQGEALYAIPMEARVFFPTAQKNWFAELGRPIPTSIPDLIDLTRWWAEEGHKNEDYKLFEMPGTKGQLLDIASTCYIDSLLGQGQPLQFDKERFGAMMDRIQALDVSSFDNFEMGADDEDWLETSQKALLSYGMGYSLQDAGSTYTQPLNLSFDGHMPAWRSGGASLLAIPATAEHPQEALRFLSAYVQSMQPLSRAALSNTWSEPIPNPQFDQYRRTVDERLAALPISIEKAEGAEKRALEQDLAYFQKELANLENHRYTVTADGLQAYKQVMSGVFFHDSISDPQHKALTGEPYLFGQYEGGTLTLDQFIQQANDKIRLVMLESQ